MGSLTRRLRRKAPLLNPATPDLRVVKHGDRAVYVEYTRNGPPPGTYRPEDLGLAFAGARPAIDTVVVLAAPRRERRRGAYG